MNASPSMKLQTRVKDGVETWSMAFPPVNQLNPETIVILRSALRRAEDDKDIAAIVLTSGLRVFSAGADAGEMARALAAHGPDGLVDQFNQAMDGFRDLCVGLRKSPLLIIAALSGHTLAGGLELAAACDLRFASSAEKLQIGVPEMDLFGVLPTGGGGAQFLTRLMGPSRALRFILEAKPVNPQQAYDLGLVERLCPPESLLGETEQFARLVVKKAGRIGIAAAKRAILGGAELPLAQALEFDHSVHWDTMRRGNFRAGAVEFVARYGSSK